MANNGALRVTFHGAARTVTGSLHLIEHNGKRTVLDCGMVQGRRKEAFRKNRDPAVDPASVDAVILSHAHIDHSGNLPTFCRMGFRGSIYATPASRDLCEVMLLDSARVQDRQVELVNRLRKKQGRNPFEPLYTERDVASAMKRFVEVPYDRPTEVHDGLTFTFQDAGHILGSALTVLEFGSNGSRRTLLFTGDLGRKGRVILRDPVPVPKPDYVITESTYGDRKHPDDEGIKAQLESVISRIQRRKSRLIVPAFSVGRTQALIYHLHELHEAGRIRRVPIYLDSPLALKTTEVFRKHTECYDAGALAFLLEGEQPFGFDALHYVESVKDSKKLNHQHGPFLVISASGMCEGGRVVHHLAHAVGDRENVILLTGFQAPYTLGRKLRRGESPVNIMGRSYALRAEVEVMEALSAHADADEMVEYFDDCDARPERAFLVHGQESQAEALRKRLSGALGWRNVEVPAAGDAFVLE